MRPLLLDYLCALVIVMVCSFGGSLTAQRQGFDMKLVAGANFSQLDGDGLSGFDKFGLVGGVEIAYPLSVNRAFSIGILYDQKGSRSKIRRGIPSSFIQLNYMSLPLSYQWLSWYDEEISMYKIAIKAIASPSRLLTTSSTHLGFDRATDDFKRWDINLGLAAAYRFTPRSEIAIGLERSLLKIYRIPGQDLDALQSYLLRLTYGFHLGKY